MHSRTRNLFELTCNYVFHSLGDPYNLKCMIRNNSERVFQNLEIRFVETRYERECVGAIPNLPPHDPEDDPLEVVLNIQVKRSIVAEHTIEELSSEFCLVLESADRQEKLVETVFARGLQVIACPTFSRFRSPEGYVPTRYNVLIFGKVSSGKTSMVNSFYTLLNPKSEVSQLGNVRDGDDHCTRTIQRYEFKKNTGNIADYSFSITDCWGLDEKNYDDYKFLSLLSGSLPGAWKMDYSYEFYMEVLRKRPELIVENKVHRKIHCVLFIITFEDIERLEDEYDRIRKFFTQLREIVRNPIIVISRTDDFISEFRSDPHVETEAMERMRYRVSKKLLISPNDIFFGINYIQEQRVTFGIDQRNFQILYRALLTAEKNYRESLVEISVDFEEQIFGESYHLKIGLRNKTRRSLRHLRLFFLETPYEHQSSSGKYIAFLPAHEEDSDPTTVVTLEVERKRNAKIEHLSSLIQISLETENRDNVISRRRFRRELPPIAHPTIKNIAPPKEYLCKNFHLLVIGSTSSGKSSWINSIYTLLNPNQRICSFVKTSDTSNNLSCTRRIERYCFNEAEETIDFVKEYKFAITDCWGLEHLQEFQFNRLLAGMLPEGYHFGDGISKTNSGGGNEDKKVHAAVYFIDFRDLLLLVKSPTSSVLEMMKMTCLRIRKNLGENPIVVISRADAHMNHLRNSPEKFHKNSMMVKLKSLLAGFLGVDEEKVYYGMNYCSTEDSCSSYHIDRLNFSILYAALKQAERNFVGLAELDYTSELRRMKRQLSLAKSQVQEMIEKMSQQQSFILMSSSSSNNNNNSSNIIAGLFLREEKVGRYALFVGQDHHQCVYSTQAMEEFVGKRMGYKTLRVSNPTYQQLDVSMTHFMRTIEECEFEDCRVFFYFSGEASQQEGGIVIEGAQENGVKSQMALKDLLIRFDRIKKKNCDVYVCIDILRYNIESNSNSRNDREGLTPPRICNFEKNFVLGFCDTACFSKDDGVIRLNEFSKELMLEMKHFVPFHRIISKVGERMKSKKDVKGMKFFVYVDSSCCEGVLDSCL